MDIESYKKMLNAAHHDLEAAMEEREKIEKTISGLKQTIIALTRVCNSDKTSLLGIDVSSIEGFGITDQCREAIRTAGKNMTPVEVRDQLIRMGLKPENYTNLLASIHRILKRLLENKEIIKTTTVDGETAYYRRPIYTHNRRARRNRTTEVPKIESGETK